MSQNRAKDFKKGVDLEDGRRRRYYKNIFNYLLSISLIYNCHNYDNNVIIISEANLNVLRKEKKEEGCFYYYHFYYRISNHACVIIIMIIIRPGKASNVGQQFC